MFKTKKDRIEKFKLYLGWILTAFLFDALIIGAFLLEAMQYG